MTNIKYRIGREELINGAAGDFTGAGYFTCDLVQQGSTFQSENPTTVGGFSNLLPATGGSGYTLTGGTITEDSVRDKVFFSADNPAFTGLTPGEIVVGLLIYKTSGSVPYWGIGLGQPVTIPDSGEYEFPFDSDGIIEI